MGKQGLILFGFYHKRGGGSARGIVVKLIFQYFAGEKEKVIMVKDRAKSRGHKLH